METTNNFERPPKKAMEEAKNHPTGYVYVIDDEYADKEDVPPEFIKGCWKVNSKGIIIGSFIQNPKHKSKLS